MPIDVSRIIPDHIAIPQKDSEACGIFGVFGEGEPSKAIVETVFKAASQLEHRGGNSPLEGISHGSGIKLGTPRKAILEAISAQETIPHIGMGTFFVSPQFPEREERFEWMKKKARLQYNIEIIDIREEPLRLAHLPPAVRESAPQFYCCYFKPLNPNVDPQIHDKNCYLFTQDLERTLLEKGYSQKDFHVASFEPTHVIFKALAKGYQLRDVFPMLSNPYLETDSAVFHRRRATRTSSEEWFCVQPFLFAHNGEFTSDEKTALWGTHLEENLRDSRRAVQITLDGVSDTCKASRVAEHRIRAFSQYFDSTTALIAGMQTILSPAQKSRFSQISAEFRKWLRYHTRHLGGGASLSGPAAAIVSVRRAMGLFFDVNGSRPGTYIERKIDGKRVLCLSSELGAIPGLLDGTVKDGGVLGPGEFIVGSKNDDGSLEILKVEEARARVVKMTKERLPAVWAAINGEMPKSVFSLDHPLLQPEEPLSPETLSPEDRRTLQIRAGWRDSHLKNLAHLANMGTLRVQAMGSSPQTAVLRTPLASVYDFAKELFAQITAPSAESNETEFTDASSEEEEMFDLTVYLGGRRSDTAQYSYAPVDQIVLDSALLTNQELQILLQQQHVPAKRIFCGFDLNTPQDGNDLRKALEAIGQEAVKAVRDEKKRIIVLSQRIPIRDGLVPLEAPDVLGAVIKALNDGKLRHRCSIVIEAADVKEAHDVAFLMTHGANAINPFLAEEEAQSGIPFQKKCIQVLDRLGGQEFRVGKLITQAMMTENPEAYILKTEGKKAISTLYKGFLKGLKKVMAKIGILPGDSYRAAKLMHLEGIAEEIRRRLYERFPFSDIGGHDFNLRLQYLRERYEASLKNGQLPPYSEVHAWKRRNRENPNINQSEATIIGPLRKLMRHPAIVALTPFQEGFRLEDLPLEAAQAMIAAFTGQRNLYGFCIDSEFFDLRDLTDIDGIHEGVIEAAAIEPVDISIAIDFLKRMQGGHMSYGALQQWQKEAIEVALHFLGTFAGSGEGGLPHEFICGDVARPGSVQIASARFGVSAAYLAHPTVREINVKIGQGAKPGEGGQLPWSKNNPWVAKNRHCSPWVPIFSKAMHPDNLSIEDQAQMNEDWLSISFGAGLAEQILSGRDGEPINVAEVIEKLVAGTGIGSVIVGDITALGFGVEIDGVRGSTGAASEESLHHAGLTTEEGLREGYRTLIQQRLKDLGFIRALGGVRCAVDMIKYMLLGADKIGAGSLLMTAGGCNHQDHCDAGCGIEIAQWLQMKKGEKLTGNYADMDILLRPENRDQYRAYIMEKAKQIWVFWYAMALELAVMFRILRKRHPELESPEDLIGRVDLLKRKGGLAQPAASVDLSHMLSFTESEAQFVERGGHRARNRRIWDRTETLKRRKEFGLVKRYVKERIWPEGIELNVEEDRSFGGSLAGARERAGITDELFIRTHGCAGTSYAVCASKGMHFVQTGFAEMGVGKSMSDGASVSIRRPPKIPLHIPLTSQIFLYGATGGTGFADTLVGPRCGERLSGDARLFCRGGGALTASSMMGGHMILLPDPELFGRYEVLKGRLGAMMTGGEIFVWVHRQQDVLRHIDGTLQAIDIDEDPDVYARFFTLVQHFGDYGLEPEETEFWRRNFRSDHGKVVCVRPKILDYSTLG